MGISDLERRVEEYHSLIKSQRRLIRNLQRRNKDLTSARIVFDSLRFSLFLATHDWHRARCQGQLGQFPTDAKSTLSARHSKLGLVVLTHKDSAAGGVGGKLLAKKGENPSLGSADDEKKEPAGSSSTVAKTKTEQKNESPRRFDFRPLTEEEKKEFTNSLTTEGRLKLIDSAEIRRSTGSAA